MEATPEELALRDEAAAEARRRIRADRARASERLQALLAYLEEHLCDDGLDVTRWFRACGIRAHSIRESFQRELGLSPLAYVRRHRILTARRLLIDSGFSVWRVAQLVGYRRADAFRDAFRQETGTTPLRFRRSRAGARARKGPTPRYVQELARMRDWRRATFGAASPELLAELGEKLLADYPFLQRYKGGRFDRKLEEELAETAYRQLADYSFADQKLLARLQVGFHTTAFFDLLRKKSLEEGRLDRRRGVELAHVALASLDAIADDHEEDLPNRKAEGLVCLANAYWLAADYSEAESGFDSAKIELRRSGDHADPLVEAELRMHEAGLRWYQRRYQEALGLVNRAIPIFEKYDQAASLAAAYALRGGVLRDMGATESAVVDFHLSLNIVDERKDHIIYLSALSGISLAYRLLGKLQEAKHELTKAMESCDAIRSTVSYYQIVWTFGLLEHELGNLANAEVSLNNALAGLSEAEEIGYSAVVLLDLALLYAEQGRPAKVLDMAVKALPMLESLKLREEALGALRLLHRAVESEGISLPILQNLRDLIAESQADLTPRARGRVERR